MPHKPEKSAHDEQTSAAAESLRAAVRDVRGGMTQAQTATLLEKLEGIAKGLDEQGKSAKEIEKMHEEAGEPDPNKSAAELLQETIEADKDAAENLKDKNVSSPGVPGGIATMKDLGQPAVKSTDSSKTRDEVEAAAISASAASRQQQRKK